MTVIGESHPGPAIDSAEALVVFMDDEAQVFAQRAVDDYTRARARIDPGALFVRPDVMAIVARAHAEAYPVALTLVAVTVESALAAQAYDRDAQLHALIAVVQAAFARRARPPVVTADAWNMARAEIVRWLGAVARRAPQTTDEIVAPFIGSLLALMPIHDDLGRDDFPLLRGALRALLAGARARFMARANVSLLAKVLTARP